MKLSVFLLSLLIPATTAFLPVQPKNAPLATSLSMFGGAGAGMPSEDNPEEQQQMEAAAKQLGMSVDEYQLGMRARVRLMEELDKSTLVAGKSDTVSIERDGNNPPKTLTINITQAGKDLGKEQLSKELVSALKKASEDSKKVRQEAQKGMMQFINDEMKKMGKA